MKWMIAILILTNINAETIKNFTSDGCSLFPDGTLSNANLWLHCCIRHDIEYWMGGSYEDRVQADAQFEQCIDTTGTPATAALMHFGVRLGGSPYLLTPFRWGYGWDYGRWYQKRNHEEQKLVEDLKQWWPNDKKRQDQSR